MSSSETGRLSFGELCELGQQWRERPDLDLATRANHLMTEGAGFLGVVVFLKHARPSSLGQARDLALQLLDEPGRGQALESLALMQADFEPEE